MYAGKTGDEWRALAKQSRQRSADSFARSDTDGFLSQWASDTTAREYDTKAEVADDGGTVERDALFLADGTVASIDYRHGDYGPYWLLNDAATAVYGKRFYNPSQANKAKTRNANNRKKGFTVGRIRIAAFVTLSGSGTGMSGAMSVRPVILADRDAVKANEYTVIATDSDTEDY